MSPLSYIQFRCHVHPFLFIDKLMFDAVVEAAGDDVVECLFFQLPHYMVTKEATVHTDKTYAFTMQFRQGVIKNGLEVGRCGSIAGSKPKVGYYAKVRHKSQ